MVAGPVLGGGRGQPRRGNAEVRGRHGLDQPAQLRTKDFPLPTTFRVGLAYDLIAGENNRLTLLSDFNQQTSNKAGFVFGSEFAATIPSSGGSSGGWRISPSSVSSPGRVLGSAVKCGSMFSLWE